MTCSMLSATSFHSLPQRVDALVVGGGVAGAAAAIELSRAGMQTLVVDRLVHPREKVCGCCLAPAGVALLKYLQVPEVLRDAMPLDSVRLRTSRGEAVVRRAGSISIARSVLDAGLLAEAARHGALLAWPVRASIETTGAVRLRHDGHERIIHAGICIAADGLQGSSLVSHPHFAWRIRPSSLIGIGAMLPQDSMRMNPGEILMCVHAQGYVGAVQLSDGRIDVAAALRPNAIRSARNPALLIAHILGDAVRHAHAITEASWIGTPLLTRQRWQLADRGVLVAGDAANYAEPFTGEGMSWALATGAAAGVHATRVLRGEATEAQWNRIGRGIVRAARWRCLLTATLLRHPIAVAFAMRGLQTWPGVSTRIANTFGARLSMPTTQVVGT